MEMPYTDITRLIFVVFLFAIIAFSYCVITSIPDPTVYPVKPTMLWEVCNGICKITTLLTMAYPASIPVWFYSIVSIIDALTHNETELPEVKKEFDVTEYLKSRGLLEKYEKAKIIVKSQMC